MLYDVTIEQPIMKYRRATLRVEATDAHDAYVKAKQQVQEADWLTDPQEYLGEFADVEAQNVNGGWRHSWRDENGPFQTTTVVEKE